MDLTFTLNYDRKALTAMAKALRTGLQAEQNKKSLIFGWVVVALTAMILLFSGKAGVVQAIGWLVVVLFSAYLIWQDQVNGTLAMWKLPKKMRQGQWLFREDGYFSNTEAGESDYSYKNIFAILETQGYMLLIFFEGQAHIVELSTIQGGTAEDFRRLLRRQTGLTIQTV